MSRVWMHRIATIICLLLAAPAIIWWSKSVLFVILVSLATQAYTSWSAAEASDDRSVCDRLDRIEHALAQLTNTDEEQPPGSQ